MFFFREPVDKNIKIWDRLPGQANRIPNKLSLILPSGRKGCSVARFSPDGRYGFKFKKLDTLSVIKHKIYLNFNVPLVYDI